MRHLALTKLWLWVASVLWGFPRGKISWLFFPLQCAFTQRKLSVCKILKSFVFNPRNVKKTRNQELSQTGLQNLDMGMKVSNIPTTFHVTVCQPYKIKKENLETLVCYAWIQRCCWWPLYFIAWNMNKRKLYLTRDLQSNFPLSVPTVSYNCSFRLKTFLYGDWFLLDKFPCLRRRRCKRSV